LLARRRDRRRRQPARGLRPVRGDDRLDGRAPLIAGRAYWLKLGTQTVSATVQQPKYQVNVNTMEHLAAKTLELNAIGVAELSTDRPIVFEPYADNRTLGGFILIDKITNATVAAGMLHFSCAARRTSIGRRPTISREAHAASRTRKPRVVVHRPFGLGQVDHRQSGRETLHR
jgi:sulfate adenylyltransferase subunit 1 (EFTu-like GTPase family)